MTKQNKKIYTLLPVALVLVLGLSGCGKSISQMAGEKVAEKAIEKQTGGNVDIDNGSFKMETDQGKYEAGENVKLPDDFPKDVYVMDGIIKTAISNQADGGFMISIETDKSVDDVASLYQEKLKDESWKITGTMNFNDSITIAAEKDDKSVSVMASKGDEGKNMVVVIVGKK